MAHPAAGFLDAGAWLLAQAAAQATQVGPVVPDTVVTIQAPIQPGWFERFQETLRALMTLAILVLTVAVVPAAWNFRKSYQKISDLLDKVYADVTPITRHASRVAENVDYVTTAVRADTQRASALLSDAEQRLRAALERAEARARDLEALLDVAQDEAERSLVSAASTVAGVREGVASLRADLLRAVRAEPAGTEDDVALVEVRHARQGGAFEANNDPEEFFDGEFDPPAGDLERGPRVRPRARG